MSEKKMTTPTIATGAGYISAVIAGDIEMMHHYRRAFDEADMLNALTLPIAMLGKLAAQEASRPGARVKPTAIGDRLVARCLQLATQLAE